MKKMKELQEIFTIFLRYASSGEFQDEFFSVSARHDAIYLLGPKPNRLTKADAQRLSELNCEYNEELYSWEVFV